MEKKRVLVVTQHLDAGGIESFLYNLYNELDKNKVQIDFFTTTSEYMFYEKSLKEKGAKIYTTPYILGLKNKILFFTNIYKLLKKNKYNAIHTNMDFFNGVPLLAAYMAKIPVRISHSHNTDSASGKSNDLTLIKKMYRIIMRSMINIFLNEKLGCSVDANLFMYGSKVVEKDKTKVIFNGIDKSKFNENKYESSDIKINKNIINFVTVGRMCAQKNSLFIAEIINELSKITQDIHLYWIGVGGMEEDIKEFVYKNNIQSKISFLGKRDDVHLIFKSIDYFLFPSQWEGLPVVLVEAQFSNIPCFISDKITKEADLGLCTQISLKHNAKEWAKIIHEHIDKNTYKNSLDIDKANKFDIKIVAKEMESIYCKSYSKGSELK